jgi:hypothetical protein
LKLFFYVLSETVFAHIFPVSTENENERVSLEFIFSVLSETVFPVFPVSAENKNERPTRRCAGSLEFIFSVLSEKVFAHIFPVSNENKNKRRILHTIVQKKKKLEICQNLK